MRFVEHKCFRSSRVFQKWASGVEMFLWILNMLPEQWDGGANFGGCFCRKLRREQRRP